VGVNSGEATGAVGDRLGAAPVWLPAHYRYYSYKHSVHRYMWQRRLDPAFQVTASLYICIPSEGRARARNTGHRLGQDGLDEMNRSQIETCYGREEARSKKQEARSKKQEARNADRDRTRRNQIHPQSTHPPPRHRRAVGDEMARRAKRSDRMDRPVGSRDLYVYGVEYHVIDICSRAESKPK
jgi:hypothetical protein